MLIGLTGFAAAGKDSTAAVLAAAGWQTIAFADALRIEVAAAWGIDPRLLTDRNSKERASPQLCAGAAANANWLRWVAVQGISLIDARSPRWVLQQWGTFRRDHDPLHWVRQVAYWVQYQRQHHHRCDLVVTDVRMQNEAAALRALDAQIVRVVRPGGPALPDETAAHESERHTQIMADGEIHNDGTLQDLPADVWRVVQQLARDANPSGAAPS